jgi:tetratricopeptide (TPR) repeat protein
LNCSSLLFSALLFFCFIVPHAHAGEYDENNPPLLSELNSGIEQLRNLANEPIPLSTVPDPSLLAYEKSLKLVRGGNNNLAIDQLREILISSHASETLKSEVRATLGYLYLNQLRPKEALEEFSILEKETSFRETALFGIANSLFEQEEFVKAIAIFEELLKASPEGEHAPEAYFKIGQCYSKLLSYQNSVIYFQKALHQYNRRIQSVRKLLKASQNTSVFQKEFLLNNADPDWKYLLGQIRSDREGAEFLNRTVSYFNLQEKVNKNPPLQQNVVQVQKSLSSMTSQVQKVIQKYIQASLNREEQLDQTFSSEAAVELARNMIFENTLQVQNSGGQ